MLLMYIFIINVGTDKKVRVGNEIPKYLLQTFIQVNIANYNTHAITTRFQCKRLKFHNEYTILSCEV